MKDVSFPTVARKWRSINGLSVVDRRALLQAGGSAAFLVPGFFEPRKAHATGEVAPHPIRKNLEAGDFLWPRKKGMYVPFNTSGLAEQELERRQWEEQRDRFVTQHAASSEAYLRAAAARLRDMSFAEFHSLYLSNRNLTGTYNFSASNGRFGHVGIVAKERGGGLGVIEAMPVGASGMGTPVRDGVRFVAYDRWIGDQKDSLVWAGRLRGFDQQKRAIVADAARASMGKEYWLWNLDLSDERHFYCSKLCWLAIYKALKFAIDGEIETKRSFWFTPKQFINLSGVSVFHSPESY